MFVGFFKWWYGDGLNTRFKGIAEQLARVSDFFSIGLLAGTLFSPFRQLSSGAVNSSLEAQLRALFDNIVSRLIGAFVRSAMIIFGLCASLGVVVYGVVVIAVWLLLPLLPVGGALLTGLGRTI